MPMQNVSSGVVPSACPHLGLAADPATRFGYPASGNYCHRGKAPAPVATAHQTDHCLATDHMGCPVFRGEASTTPGRFVGSGAVARWNSFDDDRPRRSAWTVIGAGGLVLTALLAGAIWGLWGGVPPLTVALPTPTATERPAPTVPATAPPSPALSPTPGPTATPLPTPSPTPVPAGAPVGPYALVVYTVRELDSLATIAFEQHTTTAVMRVTNGLVNADLLMVGQVLVVPMGVTSPEGLPRFELHRVEADAPASDLARELGVDTDELMRVNALEQAIVPGGRTLFVPRPPLPTQTPAPGLAVLWEE